jgi:hypothetical protein
MKAIFSHLIRPSLSLARIGIVSVLVVVDESTFETDSGNKLACSVFCEQIAA